MEQFIDITMQLLEGFGTNVMLFVLTLVLSIPLGLFVAFCSMSKFKPLALVTKLFIWVIRGTPLLLQIFIFLYVPGFLGVPMQSRLIAVQIAFIINYAAYFSEIYRGGIESVPQGQYEAGQVLGMTKTQIFKNVILMQVVKRIMPSMSNEIITLVKDTALARVVAVIEIFKVAESIMANSGLIYPLFYTGVFFLIFNGLVTVLLNKLENKLNYYKI